jgi:hypothetical protein
VGHRGLAPATIGRAEPLGRALLAVFHRGLAAESCGSLTAHRQVAGGVVGFGVGGGGGPGETVSNGSNDAVEAIT